MNDPKIPIISPRLVFVQKAFLVGLFSRELIFGGAYYWREFCVSKWVGLDSENGLKHEDDSLKQLTQTVHGLIFGSAYYRGFTRENANMFTVYLLIKNGISKLHSKISITPYQNGIKLRKLCIKQKREQKRE